MTSPSRPCGLARLFEENNSTGLETRSVSMKSRGCGKDERAYFTCMGRDKRWVSHHDNVGVSHEKILWVLRHSIFCGRRNQGQIKREIYDDSAMSEVT